MTYPNSKTNSESYKPTKPLQSPKGNTFKNTFSTLMKLKRLITSENAGLFEHNLPL